MEADRLDFPELQKCAVPKKTLSGIVHLFHPSRNHSLQIPYLPTNLQPPSKSAGRLTCMTFGLVGCFHCQ
jgi:hypothetical protein